MPEGAIIAFAEEKRIDIAMDGILFFEDDPQLADGALHVEADTGSGFYFRAHLSRRSMSAFCNVPQENPEHRNISVFALSAGLHILKDNLGESNWREYTNLKNLAGRLNRRELPLWDSKEFSPERVATAMYPLKFASYDKDRKRGIKRFNSKSLSDFRRRAIKTRGGALQIDILEQARDLRGGKFLNWLKSNLDLDKIEGVIEPEKLRRGLTEKEFIYTSRKLRDPCTRPGVILLLGMR